MEYIQITENAKRKIMALIHYNDNEVGWHMLMNHSKENNTHIVYDIVVYPQYVSAASIVPDQEEYGQWLTDIVCNQPNKHKNMKGHGHSHVNMEVFSSSVDDTFQKDIICNLKEDQFYLFIICNKKGHIEHIMYKGQKKVPSCLLTPETWAALISNKYVKERKGYESSQVREFHRSKKDEKSNHPRNRRRSYWWLDRRNASKTRS